MLAVIIALRAGGLIGSKPGAILLAAIAGLGLALVEHPGPIALLLSAVTLVLLALTGRSGWTASIREWMQRLWMLIWRLTWQPARDLLVSERWRRTRGAPPGLWTVLRHWAVPIALTAGFVFLFHLANPIISRWLGNVFERVGRILDEWWQIVPMSRLLFWLLAASVIWTLMRVRPRRAAPEVIYFAPKQLEAWTAAALVVRSLALFNIAFAVQNLLDLRYLWTGTALPAGMTYAQYVHRGAYPLVATALLAACFVLLTFRAGGSAERSPWARRLVYLLIGQNVLLLAGALWRLCLYVDAYSLTRWRIAAGLWMVLVGLGLAWIVARLFSGKSNVWLLRANVLTAAALLYACAFVNFDGLIADYNVRHCREVRGYGVAIDLDYLRKLGPDAIPAFRWLSGHARDPQVVASASWSALLLERELGGQLSDWRGWTWRRHRIADGPVASYAMSAAPAGG